MKQKNENISVQKKIYQKMRYNILQRHIYGITSPLRVTPDFLIIGAKRCGTTSLYEYLGEHPCIKKSFRDHIGFFDDNFQLGINFYKSFFPTIFEKKFFELKNGKFLSNDVTSSYIQNLETAEHVFSTLPKSKIIAILRNPTDRAYSEYNLHLRSNSNLSSFESHIENEMNKNKTINDDKHTKDYLKKGFYFEQLTPWFKLFPRKNILILSTEEFGKSTSDVFNNIFEFLQLEKYHIENPKRMQRGVYSKLNPVMRKKIIEYFRPKNKKLYDLVGKDFSWEK
jgi:hypothetical protein